MVIQEKFEECWPAIRDSATKMKVLQKKRDLNDTGKKAFLQTSIYDVNAGDVATPRYFELKKVLNSTAIPCKKPASCGAQSKY